MKKVAYYAIVAQSGVTPEKLCILGVGKSMGSALDAAYGGRPRKLARGHWVHLYNTKEEAIEALGEEEVAYAE